MAILKGYSDSLLNFIDDISDYERAGWILKNLTLENGIYYYTYVTANELDNEKFAS